MIRRRWFWGATCALVCFTHAAVVRAEPPTPLIFDTDIGNSIDDLLALGAIHALENRGECRLLAVTINKDNPYCAPLVDLFNTFYGSGDVPIGAVREGKTPDDGPYARQLCEARDGVRPRHPRDLASGRNAPEAVQTLRSTLASQADGSVVIVAVGFSTNLARLLDSQADDLAPLTGEKLVAQKCRLLSIMAGNFSRPDAPKEYNVYIDQPAAEQVFRRWPTPIVASGFEIGEAVVYPAARFAHDYNYAKHHPLREAYALCADGAHDLPAWDLTSVLYAVRPAGGYFGLSAPGTIRVTADSRTLFKADPAGRHRYLTVNAAQAAQARTALVQLASSPPAPRAR
jgi:inosine-uridine nucleoside N-ribohydrolase